MVTSLEWAEELIKQLPDDHDGRNSWLLNHGGAGERVKQLECIVLRLRNAAKDYSLGSYALRALNNRIEGIEKLIEEAREQE